MNRERLCHALSATSEVSGDVELFVFGSQAILGDHRTAPEAVRMSMEVDMQPTTYRAVVSLVVGTVARSAAPRIATRRLDYGGDLAALGRWRHIEV